MNIDWSMNERVMISIFVDLLSLVLSFFCLVLSFFLRSEILLLSGRHNVVREGETQLDRFDNGRNMGLT